MTAIEVEGDLLNFDAKHIVHQTNCISHGVSGLAYYLFNKYPETDVYAERKKWNYIHKPGEIYIRPTNDDKYVINAMGQVTGGGSHEDNRVSVSPGVYVSDTSRNRESYFSSCLNKIYMVKKLESIAFPYGIGCGIAKGNWDNYKKMIDRFADDLSDPDHPNYAKVYIVRRPGD